MKEIKKYFSKIFVIDRRLNYGRHLIKKFVLNSGGEKILDLGAGDGEDLLDLKKYISSSKLFAVESFENNVYKLEKKGIQVFKINLERDKLPFEDQSVDIIIANQILEHCKELFWILSEALRVLKVGGSLIIGVPNLAAFHNRFFLLMGRQPSCIKSNSAHIRGFTKYDLVKFLNLTFTEGMILRDFEGSNFYPFPPNIANFAAKIFPTFATSIFFRFEKLKPYNGEILDYLSENQLETNFWNLKA